jgi:hypothetical protein
LMMPHTTCKIQENSSQNCLIERKCPRKTLWVVFTSSWFMLGSFWSQTRGRRRLRLGFRFTLHLHSYLLTNS